MQSILTAENFVAWSPDRPWMILHELAHAYHHQIIGHDHTALKEAFAAARRRGVYDQVRHVSGEVRRHPAKNSVMEYFARGTEAYFRYEQLLSLQPYGSQRCRSHPVSIDGGSLRGRAFG